MFGLNVNRRDRCGTGNFTGIVTEVFSHYRAPSRAHTSATISRRVSAGRSASGSRSTVKHYACPVESPDHAWRGYPAEARHWLERLGQTAPRPSALAIRTELEIAKIAYLHGGYDEMRTRIDTAMRVA